MADTNNKPLAGKVFTEDTVKALSEAYAYHACERGILIDHMHQALTDLGAEIVEPGPLEGVVLTREDLKKARRAYTSYGSIVSPSGLLRCFEVLGATINHKETDDDR